MPWRTAVAAVAACLSLSVARASTQYGVLIDAGSTGSRLHVFSWPSRNTQTLPVPLTRPVTQKGWSKKKEGGAGPRGGRMHGLRGRFLGVDIDSQGWAPTHRAWRTSPPIWTISSTLQSALWAKRSTWTPCPSTSWPPRACESSPLRTATRACASPLQHAAAAQASDLTNAGPPSPACVPPQNFDQGAGGAARQPLLLLRRTGPRDRGGGGGCVRLGYGQLLDQPA